MPEGDEAAAAGWVISKGFVGGMIGVGLTIAEGFADVTAGKGFPFVHLEFGEGGLFGCHMVGAGSLAVGRDETLWRFLVSPGI